MDVNCIAAVSWKLRHKELIMKKIYKIFAVLAILMILFVPTGSAYAQDSSENGKLVFGEDFTLKSGETLGGDLIVFGGNVTIEKDSVVQGSIVVFGGNVDFAESAEVTGDVVMIGGNMDAGGIVDGSITVIGGQIALTGTAVVHGDVGLVGGQLERDPEAQVDGDVVENIPAPSINLPDMPRIPNLPGVPNVPNPPNVPEINVRFNPFWEAMNILFRALAVAAVAMLLTLFLEPNMQRVADAIVRQPVIAGSIGMLTVVIAPIVMVILIITIILIPVAALIALILPLAWLFGVIALGQEVGERFTKAINQTWAPVLTSGFGAFLLMLVGGYIGMIPCIGWLLPFLIGLMAVGGVMMTWFGSRLAPGTVQQPVEVPPAS